MVVRKPLLSQEDRAVAGSMSGAEEGEEAGEELWWGLSGCTCARNKGCGWSMGKGWGSETLGGLLHRLRGVLMACCVENSSVGNARVRDGGPTRDCAP